MQTNANAANTANAGDRAVAPVATALDGVVVCDEPPLLRVHRARQSLPKYYSDT